jgi:hypothetical protein
MKIKGVKRKSFEIWARQVNFSGSKKKETNETNEINKTNETNGAEESLTYDDDLPF